MASRRELLRSPHTNVFCQDSSHFSSCFFDARVVACLLCHKASACRMTYATRTTTATFLRSARKRNQGSTGEPAARGRVPIKTHNPRRSAGLLKKKRRCHRPYAHFSFTFQQAMQVRSQQWYLIGSTVEPSLLCCPFGVDCQRWCQTY